jgi:hypothetical protein
MNKIFDYASKRLYNLQPPLPPHKRILLWKQYSLAKPVWLYPAVVELLERVEPLNLDEAQQIGLELFQKISSIREALATYRSEDGIFHISRTDLTRYASSHLEGRPRPTLVVPLPVNRRIME